MTLTPIQEIACAALRIECKIPGHDLQMAALVYLFGKIAGVTDCNAILAGAQTITCLTRQQQLPALIFLAQQILNNLPVIATGPQGPAGAPGPVLTFSGDYAGIAPPFTPSVSSGQLAIAYDTSTNQPWWFVSGAWTT